MKIEKIEGVLNLRVTEIGEIAVKISGGTANATTVQEAAQFLAERFKKIFETICGIDATPADGQIKALQAKLAEMQVKYDAAEKAFSEKKAEVKKPYSDPEDEAVNKHSRKKS